MAMNVFAGVTTFSLPLLDANFAELSGQLTGVTNTNGNIGIGGAVSSWAAGQRAIQFAAYPACVSLSQSLLAACYGGLNWGAYCTDPAADSWAYTTTGDRPTRYRFASGIHRFQAAVAGTAGGAVTWIDQVTIDTSGNLLLGVTTYANVNANALMFSPVNGVQYTMHAAGTASGTAYQNFSYNGTVVGSITQSGTTGVLYNTTSDQRLKTAISDAAPAGELIDAVQVRQFRWLADGSHQRYGFIAQELVQVVPEAVHQPADPVDMMAVDYSKLVPLLVAEVQSLRRRLAALEGAP